MTFKQIFRKTVLINISVLLVLSLGCINGVLAASGNVVAKLPDTAYFFVHNPKKNEIYATTSHNILIINPQEPITFIKIPIWGEPRGLDVSADGNTLYVATSTAQQLAVIDIPSQKILAPIPLPYLPYDLKVGKDGRIYATSANARGIMQIDAKTGKFIKLFGEDVWPQSGLLLQMSPGKNILYSADLGYSPSQLNSFDVSTDVPNHLWQNEFGSLGSNGHDLELTANGDYIYYAVGGGNRIIGYDIARIRTSDMTIQGALLTGAYPVAIALSKDGKTAYTDHSSSEIQVWNTETQELLCEFPNGQTVLGGEVSRMIVDSSGNYLIAAYPGELRVFKSSCDTNQ